MWNLVPMWAHSGYTLDLLELALFDHQTAESQGQAEHSEPRRMWLEHSELADSCLMIQNALVQVATAFWPTVMHRLLPMHFYQTRFLPLRLHQILVKSAELSQLPAEH
jgi:hypothetical protein